jgi:hypothetical protein
MAVTNINIDSQILTFANLAAFPVTGTVKTIYIAEDTNFQYYWDGSQYVLLTTDIQIPANLTFYATTAPSAIVGYEKLVISIDDPDYDNPAVNVSTGAISGTAQLIAELASDAGIFAGNPGVITISTVGEIRRTAGSGVAEFYYEIYQRDSGGTETLIATSNNTTAISNNVYQQFQVSALFNNGTWLTTDRVVIKYYATKVGGGSNPTYDFLFGGANPVRTLFPISAQLLLNVPIAIGITGVTGGILDEVLLTDGSGKLGQSELKTVGGNSLFGSGDIPVGGGITIGTTAIASGTVGRVLFEGAGNVVQQDSTFVWNNTDKRLILGTEVVASTNSRLVVIGKGTGTNQTFAVHNSTGTNNALVVRDDGNVGIKTSAPVSALNAVNTGGAGVGTLVTLDGLATVSSTQFHNNRLEFRNVANTVFGRMFTYSGGQFNGLWLDAGANTSQVLLRTSGGVIISGANGGVSGDLSTLAELNTVSSGAALTIYNFNPNSNTSLRIFSPVNTINANLGGFQNYALSSTNVARRYTQNYLQIVTNTNGNESGDMYWRLIHNGVESDRLVLKGNGNLLLGTTSEGASATKTLVINNGTAPTGNVTDSFQLYSNDIVAGNAAPHFRTENGSIIKLYQETTGIAAAAFVSNTSLILDDSATFGGYTIGQVVAALKAQGLLA